MDKIISDIETKWTGKYIEFATPEFMDSFLPDVNLLIKKREKLKRAYEDNKEIYHAINKTLIGLTKCVFFPRPVPKPKADIQDMPKPEQFLSERQKKFNKQKAVIEEKARQKNLF